jgi:hexosaminidase
MLKAIACTLFLCPFLSGAGHNVLLPQPRTVTYGQGRLALGKLSIGFAGSPAPEDRFAADRLAAALAAKAGTAVPVAGSGRGPGRLILNRTGAVDALPGQNEQPGPDTRESYHISITSQGAEVRARSSAGLFYAVETLKQLVEGANGDAALPVVEIDDWPSLAYRGVMMDLSHGGLPTVAEIERQIDFLARWKGNQYYFYSELSIELKGYPLINPGARYTQDQVRRVIAYARSRHVDVVPCLEFYGHLHDLFRIERYADLAALPRGGDLNPRNPQMQKMVADWVGQMTALFPSPWFHIGLDEPWELERAGSAAAGGVEPGTLYLEHLNRVSELVRAKGKTVLFWADVAVGAALFEKYPTLASKLPAGTVAVPWHYDVEKDYTRMLEPFSKARVPQVVGTGIWAWDTIVPHFRRTFQNIDGFLADGRKHGTLGIVNTNWSDDAQILYRMTLPGIAYGAVAGWQSGPVDRERFFANYCARLYGGKAGPAMASALESLSEAEEAISNALGSEDMFRLWDDPFAPGRLAHARAHFAELRRARLAAEDAQEQIARALELGGDPSTIASLRLGARLLDYAGQKFIYAVEIADAFGKLGPSSTREDVSFWLGRGASARNHGRAADLMDGITELRTEYRQAWLEEYTPYRLGAALGRFDAEYEYWRRVQARIWEMQRTFKAGTPPALEALRP